MENDPLHIAVKLYELAAPIFVSLKEQVHPAIESARTEPEVKELTFNQMRILLAIRYGKDQVGKLARSAQVAQPAMSKMVDHLISLEFVRRDPHPTDRRQIKLTITPQGEALTERVLRKAAEKYVGPIASLSDSERQKLLDGIAVIYNVIHAADREGAEQDNAGG